MKTLFENEVFDLKERADRKLLHDQIDEYYLNIDLFEWTYDEEIISEDGSVHSVLLKKYGIELDEGYYYL